jgi:nucleoside-diphosphate-sugar epimerase
MKALVTGAARFRSRHLVLHLRQAGCDLTGLGCTNEVHPDAAIPNMEINEAACARAWHA